jgi:HicB family
MKSQEEIVKLQLRLPASLHRRLVQRAQRNRTSLNTEILKALEGDERRLMETRAAGLDEKILALTNRLLDEFQNQNALFQSQHASTVDALRKLAERTTAGAAPLALDAPRAVAEYLKTYERTFAPVSVTYATGQAEPFLSATPTAARSEPEKSVAEDDKTGK